MKELKDQLIEKLEELLGVFIKDPINRQNSKMLKLLPEIAQLKTQLSQPESIADKIKEHISDEPSVMEKWEKAGVFEQVEDYPVYSAEKSQILNDFAEKMSNQKDIDPEIAKHLTPEFFNELMRESNTVSQIPSKIVSTCNGRIGTDGKCTYCGHISQSTSGYCVRLMEVHQPIKDFASQSHREITDEEIDAKFPTTSETTVLTIGYVEKQRAKREGAKWYREQSKVK